MAGDDVKGNVALDDVHVSDPDNALPAWLLDAGERRAAGRCAARVWHSDRAQRVLGQCRRGCKGDGEFCGHHAAPEKRPFGVWDPEKYHSSLTRECGQRYALAVGEARLRQELAGGAPPPACAPVAAPRKARVPVLQPKYVYLPPDERGPLREFKAVPEALPPFPCRLCDQNFATHGAFMQHVHSAHHGWPEYRKRLFYLAEQFDGVQPVRAQEWRQCVDAFSEHLVAGDPAPTVRR